jgi:hypothetical protein
MKMTMKILSKNSRMLTIICFIAILWNTAAYGSEAGRDFVLLIYMNGSNLESKSQLATKDIEEMLRSIAPNDDFAALMMMGGTKTWHLDGIAPQNIASDSITCSKVTRNGFQKLASFEGKSIGNPSTLTEFVDYGMREFPAERYGLVFWNHGSGSVIGFGYDELHPDDASLSPAEIRSGLQNSLSGKRKLAFIGFDACLMATLETSAAVAPFADYMVASQELEPGEGWNYERVVGFLSRNPKAQGDEICKEIVASFVDYYSGKEQEQVTLSAVDLSKIDGLVENIGKIFRIKQAELAGDSATADAGAYRQIAASRAKTKSFGMPAFTCYGPDMADILDFCRNVSKAEDAALAAEIEKNISDAVIYSGKSKNLSREKICGLSVYFPCYNISTARNLTEYYRCGFSDEYLNFVRAFSQEWLSGNRRKGSASVYDNDSVARLSTDMILNTRKIYATVLAEAGDGKWISYGLDGDGVTLDNDGRIVKLDYDKKEVEKWDKTWISVGGKIVSAYMTLSGQNALTYTAPVYLNGELADLILVYDHDNPSGKVQGARRITGSQVPDKGFIEIKANDTITLLHELFSDSDTAEYIRSDTVVVVKKKDLRVNVTAMPKGKYRYGYCLLDLYGRKRYTKFVDYEVE